MHEAYQNQGPQLLEFQLPGSDAKVGIESK
jgi:hypothetical protein